MNKKKNIIISLISLVVCIYVNYFATDIGFRKEIMPISGAPFWFASLIMCIIIPVYIYLSLQSKNEKLTKK